MALTTGAALLGGSLASLLTGRRAANQQQNATERAAGVTERAVEQARSDLAPFRTVGQSAIDPLLSLLGIQINRPTTTAAAPASAAVGSTDPGTAVSRRFAKQRGALIDGGTGQVVPEAGVPGAAAPSISFVDPIDNSIERDEILETVQNSAAARGKLRSGGTLLELSRRLFGMQQRNRSQRFSELFNLLTLGSNAAAGQGTATLQGGSNVSDLLTQGGNAAAAGTVATGNALQNSLLSLALLGGKNK